MRDSLSCAVELRQFGVWRMGICLAAAAALGALAAWLLSGSESRSATVWALAAAAGATLLACTVSLCKVQGGFLRRSHGQWTFLPHGGAGRAADGSTGDEAEVGELALAIDLGSFMLLSFAGSAVGSRAHRRWLPAQRRGLQGSWHALRCAVHAPRAAAAQAGPSTR